MIPPSLATILAASALAAGTGLHAATWGAFKDSPYEGFHLARFLRTLVVAQASALAAVATHLADVAALVPAAGVLYTLERLATEWWKTILRPHDAAAFTIPMRLGFRGRPVDTPWRRYAVGVLVLAGMFGVGLGLHVTQRAAGAVPWWLSVVVVGGLGGWATAFGGAWKDAPIEGFSGWKFLRSPVVATTWAVPCSLLTRDWVTLCLASAGFAVATIETYKTFLTGDRAPGKFAGRARVHDVPGVRLVVTRLHAAAWVALGAAAVCAALEQPGGIGARLAGVTVAGGAAVAAAVSLRSGHVLARATREQAVPATGAPEPVMSSSRRTGSA